MDGTLFASGHHLVGALSGTTAAGPLPMDATANGRLSLASKGSPFPRESACSADLVRIEDIAIGFHEAAARLRTVVVSQSNDMANLVGHGLRDGADAERVPGFDQWPTLGGTVAAGKGRRLVLIAPGGGHGTEIKGPHGIALSRIADEREKVEVEEKAGGGDCDSRLRTEANED